MPADIRKLLEPMAEAPALLLIRHGQTAWNIERRLCGRSDVGLDEVGAAQARRLAAALAPVPLAAVVSSPLSRARQTAEPLLEGRGLSLQIAEDLYELDHGELEGIAEAALREKYGDFLQRWAVDPGSVAVPGGETLAACQARGLAALERIMAEARPGPPVAVVTHKMLISALLCGVMGLPLKHFRLIGQNNTAINLLSYRDGAWRLHRLNESSHLEDGG